MASLIRISLGKLQLNNHSKSLLTRINIQSTRTITSNLDELPPKPKPWDYNHKPYTVFQYAFDKTSARFDENTKLIVVEGPVASGKSKFAKEIARAFGMLYLPEANLDMHYINSYGYDLRKLDPLLPPSCRSFDIKDFLRNPKHQFVIRLQIRQYLIKLSQYVDALAHILSTGQGVVLDRCVYSDFVFAEALFSQKFISKAALKLYYEYRDNSLPELLRPHLIIYLDTPVPKVMENIQKRNLSCEKNSIALNQQYLEVMEKKHKQSYLKEMSKHAELLVYDWSVEGDMEIVVEDIEAIDFTKYDEQDTQLRDWNIEQEEDWACLRYKYADKKESVLHMCNIPDFDVPEMTIEGGDTEIYHRVMEQAPGEKFENGYNADMGDRGFLFKWSVPKRETLPLIERKLN